MGVGVAAGDCGCVGVRSHRSVSADVGATDWAGCALAQPLRHAVVMEQVKAGQSAGALARRNGVHADGARFLGLFGALSPAHRPSPELVGREAYHHVLECRQVQIGDLRRPTAAPKFGPGGRIVVVLWGRGAVWCAFSATASPPPGTLVRPTTPTSRSIVSIASRLVRQLIR